MFAAQHVREFVNKVRELRKESLKASVASDSLRKLTGSPIPGSNTHSRNGSGTHDADGFSKVHGVSGMSGLNPLPFKDQTVGVVVMIRVSGLTKWSAIVSEMNGMEGAAVSQLANPIFLAIFDRIHKHGGSIVKTCGDAVVAVWAKTSDSEALVSLQAILCCMELMVTFRDYVIAVPETMTEAERGSVPKGRRMSAMSMTARGSISMGSSRDARRSSVIGSVRENSLSYPNHYISVRLQIAVSFGSFAHIHVGESYRRGGIPRASYLVSGEAVGRANSLMSIGREGEIIVMDRCWKIASQVFVKAEGTRMMTTGAVASPNNMNGDWTDGAFIIRTQGSDMESFVDVLRNHIQQQLNVQPQDEISREARASSESMSFQVDTFSLNTLALESYTDDALFKHMSLGTDSFQPHVSRQRIAETSQDFLLQPGGRHNSRPDVEHESGGQGATVRKKSTKSKLFPEDTIHREFTEGRLPATSIKLMAEFNDLRKITVVHVKLISLSVDLVQKGGNLSRLNEIMVAALNITRNYLGCFQQVFDHEGVIILSMSWGVRGFSHEQGDPVRALSAALDLRTFLESLSGIEYAIVVTSGPVFSGVVGNRGRLDSTIMGVCVTLALRLLSHQHCFNRVVCDENSYLLTCNDVLFPNESLALLNIQGISHSVRVHVPSALRTPQSGVGLRDMIGNATVSGRAEELARIEAAIERFHGGKQARLLITGASGSGKTTMAHHIKHRCEDMKNLIYLVGRIGENSRYSVLLSYQQILKDLFNQLRPHIHDIKSRRSGGGQKDAALKPGGPFQSGSMSMGSNMSHLLGSTQYIEEILLAFGEPLSSMMLIEALMPGARDIKDQSNVSRTDLTGRFSRLLSRIFEILTALQYPVLLILDDLQWMDLNSFDATVDILQRCPYVFIVILSRPPEENHDHLASRFKSLLEIKDIERIHFLPFNKEDTGKLMKSFFSEVMKPGTEIDGALVNDVFERSEGTPFVIKVLCQLLLDRHSVHLHDKILKWKPDVDGINSLPKDISSAIITQFETISKDAQAILRVASIAGQYFQLPEICDVLSKSTLGYGAEVITPGHVLKVITTSDPYHFISRDVTFTETSTLSFSHYQIQTAIRSTLNPQKLEWLHSLFADYYERTLTEENRKQNITYLVHHLLELHGQYQRKLRYVNEAFELMSELYRPVEGFMYYKILINLANEFGGMSLFTPLQRAKQFRLLAQLNFEQNNHKQATANILSAMETIGFKLPFPKQKPLTFLRVALLSISVQHKLWRCGMTDRMRLSRLHCASLFPQALKNFDLNDTNQDMFQLYPETSVLHRQHTNTNDAANALSMNMLTPTASTSKHSPHHKSNYFGGDSNKLLPATSQFSNTLGISSTMLGTSTGGVSPKHTITHSTSGGGGGAGAGQPNINEVIFEICEIFDIAVRVFYVQAPGPELPLIGVLELNSTFGVFPPLLARLAKCKARVAVSAASVGLNRLSDQYYQSSEEISARARMRYDELRFSDIVSLAAAHEYQAIATQFKCDWEGFVKLINKSLELLDDLGIGETEHAFTLLNNSLFIKGWLRGKYFEVMTRHESELFKRKNLDRKGHLIAETELALGAFYALANRTDDMLEMYYSGLKRSNIEDVGELLSWRELKGFVHCFRVELNMLQISSADELGNEMMWNERLIKRLQAIIEFLPKVTSIMLIPYSAAWNTLLPLIAEWILYRLETRQKYHPGNLKDAMLPLEKQTIQNFITLASKVWSHAPTSSTGAYEFLFPYLKSLKDLLYGKPRAFAERLRWALAKVRGRRFLDVAGEMVTRARIRRALVLELDVAVSKVRFPHVRDSGDRGGKGFGKRDGNGGGGEKNGQHFGGLGSHASFKRPWTVGNGAGGGGSGGGNGGDDEDIDDAIKDRNFGRVNMQSVPPRVVERRDTMASMTGSSGGASVVGSGGGGGGQNNNDNNNNNNNNINIANNLNNMRVARAPTIGRVFGAGIGDGFGSDSKTDPVVLFFSDNGAEWEKEVLLRVMKRRARIHQRYEKQQKKFATSSPK
ncbi:Adenylate cyclase type 10 [Blyttiomyces sp. JEL0837]|nr:Adenylate cyclase type 10 [Blyttiomyces sp. JEL0837]